MTSDESRTPPNADDDFVPGLGNVPPAALEEDDFTPRRRWPWIVGGVVLLLAALVAAGPSLLSTAWLNGQVRAYLNENLEDGTKVDFAQLDVSWSDGIRLEDLQVRRSARDTEPLLRVPLVEFDADVLPLLVRRLDVRKFVFHDPVVRIERTRDGALNTEDVVKTKRKKKEGENGEETESLVLPPINVPVEVHGLRLVIVGDDGREVERGGIEFSGHLTTRKGPTTFELAVPVGGGRMGVDGTLMLFDADGTVLPIDQMTVKTLVELQSLDAAENHDLLSLFVAEAPTGGVLDGEISVDTVGRNAKGKVDLTVRGIAVGGVERARDGEPDLRITGAFETDGTRFEVRDGLVQADGLTARAALAGTMESIDGSADVDADIARSAAALRVMGIAVPDGYAGRVQGKLTFRPAPSRGDGELTVTGLRAPAAVEGGAPLSIERMTGAVVLLPGADGVRLESASLVIPDEMQLSAKGAFTKDGGIDLASEVRALVPALVLRAQAMGLAPQDLAIAGTLGGKVLVARSPGEEHVVVTIDGLALRDEGVRIQADGTLRSDGDVRLRVDGDGSIERLIAAGGAAEKIGPVKGTFSFKASAEGRPDALTAELSSLRLDGDLQVVASGSMRPDGRIEGTATLDGRIPDAIALARGLGFVEGEVPLDGRIHGDVRIGGTRERPEVPQAILRIDDGPLDVRVAGSVTEIGTVEATVEADAGVDALLAVAHAQGFMAQPYASGGRVTLTAVVAGTRDAPEIPKATLRVTGLADVRGEGSYDADGSAHVRADFSGAVERVTALLAALRGEEVQSVQGTFEGAVSLDGPPADAQIRLSRLTVRSQGLVVEADAAMRPGGTAELNAGVRGPLEGAFALAHAFGQVPEMSGTGTVDVSMDARLVGSESERALTGSLSGTLDRLAMLRSDVEGVVWSEERVVFTVPAFRREIGDGSVALPQRPIEMSLSTTSGIKLDVKAEGGTGGEPVAITADLSRGPLQPLLDAAAAFSGGGADVEVGGMVRTREPLVFGGDVSKGLEGAAGWTGGTLLELVDVTAPYVSIPKGTVRVAIRDGFVHLDPIDVAINGGTATGTAVLGLVGEKPEHTMKLVAKDVNVDAELAPLLSRAAPILAVGDAGKAGGRTGIEVELTAKGLDADKLRNTVSGEGVLRLDGVYAQSGNWIGKVLELAGAGSRLEVASGTVPFKVKRGRVVTENLSLSATGLDMRLGGEVGLDGTLEYAFGLKPTKGGDGFSKYAKLLDKDGFLPLRLEGSVMSPELKLPSIKDALTGTVKEGLGGLLDDFLNRDKDKDKADDADADDKDKGELTEEERQKRREERRKRKEAEEKKK